MQDLDFMHQALELAQRGRGWTSPNPMVGAVIVKDGRVIGRGYHQRRGQAHAERNALADCSESPEGATLYVTLEPCCHQGRQPPCTDAILEAGIRRVVVGSGDPNPLVAGKGIAQLRARGVEVTEHVLEEACTRLNRIFFHYIQTRRPYGALKYAMTLTGKLPPIPGPPGGSPGRQPVPTSTPCGTNTALSWWGWARCWRTTRSSPAACRRGAIRCGWCATPICARR